MEPVSIIIATKGRCQSLRRLFESLRGLEEIRAIRPEILVVNNADDGEPERQVMAEVELLSRQTPNVRALRDENGAPPRPKCRGQNLAIRQARGSIVAFVDDDVEVAPGWLEAINDFFRHNPYDAMQGAILMPPEAREDQAFLMTWNRYRTIPYIDYGREVMEIFTLTGPNMAIRREVFEKIGLFDERLGPGRLGMSEDVEFAQRMLTNGMRIGYEPRAAVYHEADRSRLTEGFFRSWHEQQGRSRLIYKNNSLLTIIPNLYRSLLSYGWYSLVSNERKKYRALGRCYHYLAMLKEKLRMSGPLGPE